MTQRRTKTGGGGQPSQCSQWQGGTGSLIYLSLLVAVIMGVGVGCRDVVGSAALPPGTQSPATYNTPEGALAMYRLTKAQTTVALSRVVLGAGALTDELLWADVGTSPLSLGATGDPVDERILPEGQPNDETYTALHALRGDARQAIGLLAHYAPTTSPALRGEMYALLGYAELQLAELYCSGVPLSTLDFEQDFTYRPGSTTQEVLAHALALEDTALALSGDSARALNLTRVLKGRALLELGRYADAAQAVAAVPDAFNYTLPIYFATGGGTPLAFLGWTVADTEGGNGLPFVSGGDPRVHVSSAGTNSFGRRLFTPDQYPVNTLTPAVLASGVEARLIEAEAALHAGQLSTWAAQLNALRGPGTYSGIDTSFRYDTTFVGGSVVAVDTTVVGVDTVWDFGTGRVPGQLHGVRPLLADSTTDASEALRVDVMFGERAYWLFLTGHRQGDLRRLVRSTSEGGYQRRQDRVYPTGPYYGGHGVYGSDVTLPIPSSERPNPLFHGCLSRGA